MKLETIGKILSAGFGDRIAVGIFMGLLDNVSPARAYEYIRDGIKLGYWLSEGTWQKYRRMAKNANIGNITSDDIIDELRKTRSDILSVIINTPQGREWFDKQITEIKQKLGLE